MNLDKRKGSRFRVWELALLMGLAISLLCGLWLDGQQNRLADKVIRLHIIANSDTEADQALKLLVRDSTLQQAERILPHQGTITQAAAALAAHLDVVAQAGAQVVAQAGYDYPVSVSLEQDVFFPTKQYTHFALPAGRYRALRVVIGEGAGKNWWCVVFPPLCLGAVSEAAQESALAGSFTPGEVCLVTGEEQGYIVKFKAIELWEKCKQAVSKWT